MSEKRLLRANLVFVDAIDGKKRRIAEKNSRASQAGERVTELAKLAVRARRERDGADVSFDNGLTSFSVVLTFEERPDQPFAEKLSTALGEMLKLVIDTARTVGNILGKGANLFAIFDAVLKSKNNGVNVSKVTSLTRDAKPDSLWDDVSALFSKWANGDLSDLQLGKVSKEDWENFRKRAEELDSQENKEKDRAKTETAFDVTQLFGWLTDVPFKDREKDGDRTLPHFGIRIEGYSRYPKSLVEVSFTGRLDVFGPDGRHLLVHRLTKDELNDWLNSGDMPNSIAIVPPDELLNALNNDRKPAPRNIKEVSGRLWFSDGRPFGARTLAIYVKPALARLVDDCCPPDDLDLGGCCDDEAAKKVPLLNTPQALAVTQTDLGCESPMT